VLLVVPLVLGQEEHWPVWGWVSMAAGAAFFVSFLVLERRAKAPLVPHEVLRAPGMLPAVAAIFMAMASFGGFMFAFALHLQSGLGFSAERAGLCFVPAGIAFSVASYCWRYLPARMHRWVITIGFTGAALSYAALGIAAGHGATWLIILSAALGLSLGSAYSPAITVALTYVPPARAADASGLLLTAVQFGQVVGVAAFGALFLTTLHGPILHGTVHSLTLTDAGLTGILVISALASLFLPRRATPR
jgi:predicted MFS family arabinose efflux permease